MAKFNMPPEIQKMPKQTEFDQYSKLWPLGTLYQHTASGTLFRFVPLGGRWNPHYAISTEKGIFCSSGFNNPKSAYITGDKNFITVAFIEYLKRAEVVYK